MHPHTLRQWKTLAVVGQRDSLDNPARKPLFRRGFVFVRISKTDKQLGTQAHTASVVYVSVKHTHTGEKSLMSSKATEIMAAGIVQGRYAAFGHNVTLEPFEAKWVQEG